MARVYIAIGSNMGERKANCLQAVGFLPEYGIVPHKRSSIYETEPWGVREQPVFMNMALEAETGLGPRELLEALKDIEKRMGREETVRWGPRVVDLDILLYGGLVLKEHDLEIPHPLMHERDFVLKPLSEIAPDAVHPVLEKTVRELYATLKGDKADI
jgi:2-amino-4-hydroxy-6-hydroxymethyldihydropteridine diphosphokinase